MELFFLSFTALWFGADLDPCRLFTLRSTNAHVSSWAPVWLQVEKSGRVWVYKTKPTGKYTPTLKRFWLALLKAEKNSNCASVFSSDGVSPAGKGTVHPLIRSQPFQLLKVTLGRQIATLLKMQNSFSYWQKNENASKVFFFPKHFSIQL